MNTKEPRIGRPHSSLRRLHSGSLRKRWCSSAAGAYQHVELASPKSSSYWTFDEGGHSDEHDVCPHVAKRNETVIDTPADQQNLKPKSGQECASTIEGRRGFTRRLEWACGSISRSRRVRRVSDPFADNVARVTTERRPLRRGARAIRVLRQRRSRNRIVLLRHLPRGSDGPASLLREAA